MPSSELMKKALKAYRKYERNYLPPKTYTASSQSLAMSSDTDFFSTDRKKGNDMRNAVGSSKNVCNTDSLSSSSTSLARGSEKKKNIKGPRKVNVTVATETSKDVEINKSGETLKASASLNKSFTDHSSSKAKPAISERGHGVRGRDQDSERKVVGSSSRKENHNNMVKTSICGNSVGQSWTRGKKRKDGDDSESQPAPPTKRAKIISNSDNNINEGALKKANDSKRWDLVEDNNPVVPPARCRNQPENVAEEDFALEEELNSQLFGETEGNSAQEESDDDILDKELQEGLLSDCESSDSDSASD